PQPGLLLRLFNRLRGIPTDRDSFIDFIRAAEEHNILQPDEVAMIEGVLQVCELQVRDIMIPRVQMVVIEDSAAPAEIIETVVESGHSRFPVISGHKDEVIGILLAKDLLSAFPGEGESSDFDIRDMMRPAVFVPESKRLNNLLREFRINRNHMAIIVDEYVNVAGLVTIEDVIEEIVGEIEDEHDVEDENYIDQHGRNRYTVRAITPLQDINEYFQVQLPTDEADTIGGLVLNRFGHLPKRGETIEIEGFNIKILRSDQRRIHLMRFIKLEPQSTVSEDIT
ncbi:MAG: transporter associated domain-containing protein, partial [Gammaproteobacteria bacterium]|nr:transporter associated domain-containing protein [Gammaproteobacteria bacterium]